MSKLNDLIKELCPSGVEYKCIKDLCFENFWVMPATPDYQSEGIPYVTSKNIRNGIVMFDDVKYIMEDDYKSISNNRPIKENDFLISMIGTIGEVGIVKKEDLPFYGQNMYLLRLNTNLINIRYFYHYFTSDKVRNILLGEKNNGNQGYLKTKNIELLKVPIPSLAVQEEIVRILDKFGKLEAELEAELEARNSQYEFWRGKIINQNNNLMKLKDICHMAVGGDVPKDSFSKERTEQYSIPIYSNSIDLDGLYGYTDIVKIDKPCVTLSGRGAGVGHAFLRTEPFFPIIRLVCLIPKAEFITAEYLYYAIQLVKFKIPTTGIPQLTVPMVSDYKIPVPSLEEQNRIVNILDKFDKLVNDITEGLPAEIELRRLQYEYYRNKLLSFEELIISE